MKEFKVKQLSGNTECLWHSCNSDKGKIYTTKNIFTDGMCPILFHTLYPYFLACVYKAKFSYNEQGDCNVCCPAEYGVDVLIKVRPNQGNFPDWVPSDWRDVIHAEVVNVHGNCSYNYRIGDIFVFPTCDKKHHVCPAGVNNIFPFLEIEIPECINYKKLRCPDWDEKAQVYYSLDKGDCNE